MEKAKILEKYSQKYKKLVDLNLIKYMERLNMDSYSAINSITQSVCPKCNPNLFETDIVRDFLSLETEKLLRFFKEYDQVSEETLILREEHKVSEIYNNEFYMLEPKICGNFSEGCNNTFWHIKVWNIQKEKFKYTYTLPEEYYKRFQKSIEKKEVDNEIIEYLPDLVKEYFVALLIAHKQENNILKYAALRMLIDVILLHNNGKITNENLQKAIQEDNDLDEDSKYFLSDIVKDSNKTIHPKMNKQSDTEKLQSGIAFIELFLYDQFVVEEKTKREREKLKAKRQSITKSNIL